jgi:hypothetical protein
MNSVQKFEADIRRILKRRGEVSPLGRNAPQERHPCRNIADAFCGNFPRTESLARSISDYWLKTYIEASAVPREEPSPAHIDWLLDAFSFLLCEDDELSAIPLADWKEIGALVSYEADVLPLDTLTHLMSRIVDKKAL